MKKISIGTAVLFLILTAGFPAAAQRRIVEKSAAGKTAARVETAQIKFAKIEAYSEGRGVWLSWQMSAETNSVGFTVRRTSGDGKTEAANRGLIPGAYLELGATESSNRSYSYFDAAGDLNSTYQIETFNTSSEKTLSKSVRPQQVEDLSQVAGATAETLRQAAASARPVTIESATNLAAKQNAQSAAQKDAARQLWLASQPGIKIGIRQTGIYRVTRAQMQAAGFDVSAPQDHWQLFENGVEQAINVEPNGDYIEFYGRTVDTPEADTQIYFLVAGDTAGKRMATSNRRQLPGRTSAASFDQTLTYKERLTYSSNVLNGDAENFFGTVVTSSGADIIINLPGVDFASQNSSIDLTLNGFTIGQHQTGVVINGHNLGTLNFNERTSATAHFDIPTAYLVEGFNDLQLSTQLGGGDIVFFDTAKFNYFRRFQADANSLAFSTVPLRATFLENFTSPNIRVFDITSPDTPSLINRLSVDPTDDGKYRAYLPLNRGRTGRTMFAVEDSAILAPTTVAPNQPSSLATTAHNADLVIITYKTWAAQANDWAAYRRAQGLTVEVVDIEDVFDEFNFGVYSSLSIRSFLQYATANWQTPPRYALLVGDATYDPKNYFGAGYNSYIPTRLVDTVYTEAPSDDSLADFNDDGLAELPIGRIPAKNSAYVTQQLNKVSNFEQSRAANGLAQRGAFFVSDAPNGYDFQGLSERVRQQLPQSVPTSALNKLDADANASLMSQLNSGKFIVNYSGHGSAADWAGDSSFFGKSRVPELANSNLSIFTMLTCLNGYFINPNQSANGDGLAESLLSSSNGGVAAWASTGLTTPDVQEVMATRFYQQLGAGSMTRLGDLIKDAKAQIDFGRDVRLSWVLLGDPTLKVH